MGIPGLLPTLKSIIERKHVSKYKGHKVAVDTYSWLHKGTYCCALELCTGAPTDKYITYCVDRVKMLLHNGVTPVMIFDGANLPSKTGTEEKRKSSREVNQAKGMQFLRSGNRDLANECFQKAVDVTPLMAHKLIKVLRKMKIECIVAPYEADAQLCYLNLNGYVAAIISEDTDMIAFGALVVMFKMDKEGYGDEFRQKILGACDTMNFSGWEPERVTQMCIFAGCDYLKSLGGMGPKRAHGAIYNSSANKAPLEECFVKAIAKLKMEGVHVPPDYQDNFWKAFLTFQYQRVYDPALKCLVTLKSIPEHLKNEEMPFIGADLPPDMAEGVAMGHLNPSTKVPWPVSDREREQAQARETRAEGAAHAPQAPGGAHANGMPQRPATAVPRSPVSPSRRSPRKAPKSPQSPAKGQAGLKHFFASAPRDAGTGGAFEGGGGSKGVKRQASVAEYVNTVSERAQKDFKPPRPHYLMSQDSDEPPQPSAQQQQQQQQQQPESASKRLKTQSPFASVSRVKSKFFAPDDGDSAAVDTVVDDAVGGEQERAEQEEKERRRAEEEVKNQQRMSGALAKFAYKGAGQEGVRRVGGDGPRKAAGEASSVDKFRNPVRAAGLLDDKPRLAMRRNHSSARSMAVPNLDAFRFNKERV